MFINEVDLGRGLQNKRRKIDLKGVLNNTSFVCINLAEAIRFLVVTAVITHVMPYLSSLGIPRSRAGLVAGCIPLFSILGRFGFGWLADTFDKRYVAASAFCSISLGLLAFSSIKNLGFALLFLFFFSSGFGGGMVLRGAILSEFFGRDSFGKMLGIIMGSGGIGGVIGPTSVGWMFDILGNYQLIWLFLCCAPILAAGAVLKIRYYGQS
jgi:MFS family permease